MKEKSACPFIIISILLQSVLTNIAHRSVRNSYISRKSDYSSKGEIGDLPLVVKLHKVGLQWDYKTNKLEKIVQTLEVITNQPYEMRMITRCRERPVWLSEPKFKHQRPHRRTYVSTILTYDDRTLAHIDCMGSRCSPSLSAIHAKRERDLCRKEIVGYHFSEMFSEQHFKSSFSSTEDSNADFDFVYSDLIHGMSFYIPEYKMHEKPHKMKYVEYSTPAITIGLNREYNTTSTINIRGQSKSGTAESTVSAFDYRSSHNSVCTSDSKRKEFKTITMVFLNESDVQPPVSDKCMNKEHVLQYTFVPTISLCKTWTFSDITKSTDALLRENICTGAILGTLLADFMYMFRQKKKEKFCQKRLVIIQGRRFIQRFCSHSKKRPNSFMLPSFLFQWRRSLFPNIFNVYPLYRSEGIDMSNYRHRLGTFKNRLKDIPIQPYKLASEGFYALDTPNLTKCFSCGFQYSSWKQEDDPRKIHVLNSPKCSYLRKDLNDNVDSRKDPSALSTDVPSVRPSSGIKTPHANSTISNGAHSVNLATNKEDESGNINNAATERLTGNFRPNSSLPSSQVSVDQYPSSVQSQDGTSANHQNRAPSQRATAPYTEGNSSLQNGFHHGPINNSITDVANLDGPIFDRPRYPSFAVLTVRISSYQGWPGHHTQTPKELALAGFLYAGYGDYVRCYFCGGGLRNWEPGDDPWVEHARWFPRCGFLRQNKGDDFIQLVRDHVNQESSLANSEEDEDSINSTIEGEEKITQSQKLTSSEKQRVIEMGYPARTIEKAIQKLERDNTTVTTANILDLLLDDNENSSNSAGTGDLTNHVAQNEQTSRDDAFTEHSQGALYQSGEPPLPQTTTSRAKPGTTSFETLSSQLNDLSIARSTNLNSETASAGVTNTATSLMEENRQLRSLRQCKVCLDQDASIAFLPCGHLVCCSECAPAMRRCPICRGYIKGSVKTWLA